MIRHSIKNGNQTRGHVAAHAAPAPPVPDPLAALQAQVAAQQQQIDAQAAQINTQQQELTTMQSQINTQAAQLTAMASLLPLPAPDISTAHDSTADGSVAKNAVIAAPDNWEFFSSATGNTDPNQNLSGWDSMGVLAGSADGGAVWSKHCDGGGSGPMRVARYQLNGKWSPFSAIIYTES